jgi:hypothetical protein
LVVNDRTIEMLTNEIVADTEKDVLFGENYEPVITREFLRQIFQAHDEVMVDDKVLDQMIEAVGGEGTRFNAKTFLRGLTKDLAAWNIEWETSLSTAYSDVMGLDPFSNATIEEASSAGKAKSKSGKFPSAMHSMEAPQMSVSFFEKARSLFTFSEVDNTADTYGRFIEGWHNLLTLI